MTLVTVIVRVSSSVIFPPLPVLLWSYALKRMVAVPNQLASVGSNCIPSRLALISVMVPMKIISASAVPSPVP